MEWYEVHAKTVDLAVAAALKELGLKSRDQANVEVIQQPSAGFLGLGGKDAIVKVSEKPKKSRRRRGRRGGSKGNGSRGGSQPQSGSQKDQGNKPPRKKNSKAPAKSSSRERPQKGTTVDNKDENRPEPASIEAQAEVAKEFLTGLIDAFGLEGEVTTRIDDDILWIDVTGAQTEALVGGKGSVMQSIHELTRTVIQRQTYGAPRMRLDIAGYAERRREALRIYTTRLTERLLADGGEIMLEPMNAADRKVVHDTVVDIAGVGSFSEGEEPNRAVVLSLEDGYRPTGGAKGDDVAPDGKEDSAAGEDSTEGADTSPVSGEEDRALDAADDDGPADAAGSEETAAD